MSKRSDQLLIKDILESSQKILNYTEGLSFDDFVNDSKTIDAVVRNFEIIGEAANRLSLEFKDSNNTIEWHKIKGFRNRIVHDYFGIDFKIVWNIKQNFLPEIISKITNINL